MDDRKKRRDLEERKGHGFRPAVMDNRRQVFFLLFLMHAVAICEIAVTAGKIIDDASVNLHAQMRVLLTG